MGVRARMRTRSSICVHAYAGACARACDYMHILARAGAKYTARRSSRCSAMQRLWPIAVELPYGTATGGEWAARRHLACHVDVCALVEQVLHRPEMPVLGRPDEAGICALSARMHIDIQIDH
jgi:hypothetical protein